MQEAKLVKMTNKIPKMMAAQKNNAHMGVS